jgi:hypothetical protein
MTWTRRRDPGRRVHSLSEVSSRSEVALSPYQCGGHLPNRFRGASSEPDSSSAAPTSARRQPQVHGLVLQVFSGPRASDRAGAAGDRDDVTLERLTGSRRYLRKPIGGDAIAEAVAGAVMRDRQPLSLAYEPVLLAACSGAAGFAPFAQTPLSVGWGLLADGDWSAARRPFSACQSGERGPATS